ncbi:MAG: hypothetical protein MO846_09135 [Candidatus Devosia symbiotica]|nr:hypothetical protein [Candidatus Devosia symbiotica]
MGTAKDADNVIALDLRASVASGTLVDRPLRDGMLGFTGQPDNMLARDAERQDRRRGRA